MRALHEAAKFCDDLSNREQLVEILYSNGQLRVDRGVLRMALIGKFDDGTLHPRDATSFYHFHRHATNEPGHDKSTWLAEQFIENGIATNAPLVRKEAQSCYRTDLYRRAIHQTKLLA